MVDNKYVGDEDRRHCWFYENINDVTLSEFSSWYESPVGRSL
jgi:hypothetical protein